MIPNTPPPYPFDSFYLIIRNAVEEVQRRVQAPDALVGMAFLTTISVSCQGLIDVRLPTGHICPGSLNCMTVAESGERKTGTDNLVSAPIYAFDERRAKKYEQDIAEYHIELHVWKTVDTGIRRRLGSATQKGEPLEALCRLLAEHAAKRPIKPRLRRIMRHNVTQRAIMEALQGDGEAVAFMDAEGDVILNGGTMGQNGLRNKGWDGAKLLTLDRADAQNIVVRNPRVTVGFMVQHAVLQAFLTRRGDVMRGSGAWARYLVAWPASTQGYRFMSHVDSDWTHLPLFHERVTELLEEYGHKIDAGNIERTVLEFSEEAKTRWIVLLNQTETMVQPWGYLNDIRDFASKAVEIVSRIAALLHWFSRQEGRISIDTLERAIKIGGWHLDEFKRIFSPHFLVPQVQIDAQALEHYLYTHYWCRQYQAAPKNSVLRNGPLRPVQRLDEAVGYLQALHRIWVGIGPKKERYINMQPHYFGSSHVVA